jgi:hypothetical protein
MKEAKNLFEASIEIFGEAHFLKRRVSLNYLKKIQD